ncbi:MAG: isocitrate/isopropylmalate dehydrogenase family protein [Alphaproteobacteria bacterium]
MAANSAFRIAVMPGDGIGIEVTDACLAVLDALQRRVGGFALEMETVPAGANLYLATGDAFPPDSRERAAAADAILLGAMGMPDVRYPDGTEIAPQLDLRFDLGLYAGVRPIKWFPGLPTVLADPRAKQIDLVIIRESTEGLFAARGKGVIEDDKVARDTMVITRATSERLFDYSFKLAQRRRAKGRPGLVTCIDKSNVLGSMVFFRRIFDETAQRFPDVEARHHYIDATALDLVRKPWTFDVMVTENMFGDIISDLAGGLVGGMGMASSADIGDRHAVFQPAHGTAPDIMGKGIANPTATFLSAAMMLEWLGDRHGQDSCTLAAGILERAVETGFTGGRIRPAEFGGPHGTADIARLVIDEIAAAG